MSWECLEDRRMLSTLTALGAFDGTNGTDPESAGVVFDANGNLFGTTFSGGANGVGTVWELAQGSGTITALASFDLINGGGPLGGVALDGQGNIYGTAEGSGTQNVNGMVWELAEGSSTITQLAPFDGNNGIEPAGGATRDANGDLFGTTIGGGGRGTGTVWELAKGSSTIMGLASFNLSAQSAGSGGVTLDANGDLFGTISSSGANNLGLVWELVPGSGTITTLASFDGTNGNLPLAGATLDANGDLFGTTFIGGANNLGTVWELAKGSSTITALASFNGPDGERPRSGVTLDANGNLYGTTTSGGVNSANGVVWELAKGSGAITALATFQNSTSGTDSKAGVTLDANGNLYGTAGGGAAGQGTVWELATVGDVSVVVASSAPDSRYGQAVTFTATVNPVTPGLPAPSGNVQFEHDGISFGLVDLVGGQAVSPAIATLSAGRHTITAVYANDPNYQSNSGSTPQTVEKANLTVTADDKAMIYGGAVPDLTATITGFVNGDTAAVVGGAPGLTTTATSASGVGSYAIMVAPGTLAAANYDFLTLVAGTLRVTPAPLTIRADDLTRGVGQPNPPLTASYSGFVNGDGPTSLASPAVLSTTATAGSPAGLYPITVGGAESPNYAIMFVDGTLTVVAPPPVTMTDVQPAFNRRHQVTQIIVDFSGPVDAGLADSLDTYTLTVAGRHGSFAGRHSRRITLASAVYSNSTDSVTLVPARPFSLNRPVELRVHGLLPGGDAVAILSRQGVHIEARRQPGTLPRLRVTGGKLR
jgi:uncharacterized repeat protein (TIGR03803 family)